jgi:hypothetical protein
VFQRLVLAHSDIDSAYRTCELFGEKVALAEKHNYEPTAGFSNPLYSPLVEAIVISYARPFTDNRGIGILPKKWSQFPDARLLQAHQMILRYRNQLVAHSDQEVRRIQIMPPNGSRFPNRKGYTALGPGFTVRGFGIRLSQVEVFYKLCGYQGQRLWNDVEKLLDELYGGMELPHREFDLKITEGL